MCLAVPAKVVEVKKEDLAVVEVGGVTQEVTTTLIDNVKVGDYLIIHVGHALNRMDKDEAEKTLKLFEELGGNFN